jgi:diguanylate cyclase (GGDEF)-like protein
MAVDPRLGVVALVPAPVVWLALRSHGALIQRFTDLASVHDFSRDIGDAADLRAIAETAAVRFAEHLRAERVALRLWMPDGTSIDAVVGDVSFDLVPKHANEVGWRRALARREAVRVSKLDYDLRTALEANDFLGGIIAPIADEQGQLGLAIVGDRNGASDEFDDDDASRLTAMSQQLAVAVRKGQLHSQIQFEATHDRLTSLPNRSYFETWISQSAEAGDTGAVLMLDLDRFKQINDAFGHHAGDVLLTEAAVRIRAACEPGDVVARFGGDEFAVFAPSQNGEQAQLLAESISIALEEEFDIGPANVAIGASIGVALLPDHERDATNLLRCADIAMYDAKTRRIRVSTYRSELEENSAERLTLLNDLRTALRQEKIEVHFQPQVALRSGRVSGVEALARWEHPDLGRIRPDIFIEIAEQAGLIEELTSQVLTLATNAAADWHRAGLDLSVSVNISAQSLLDERLESIVARTLLASEMKPELLILEITESTMMTDAARTDRVLHGLSELGVRLSVDDFGTGFSSLVNLRNLPVDELKIDRSFVTEMMVKHDDDVIVRSTIDLAHNLGLQVVAEGVETPDVLQRLADLGCDVAQGFGISRPVPREMFETWLAARDEQLTSGEMSPSIVNDSP